jgi:hypothetical protein
VRTQTRGDFGVLTMEREVIKLESYSAVKPDPTWHYVDKKGHDHRHGDDTLTEVETERGWCSQCRDEHVETELRCKQCGEPIAPRFVPDPGPHYITGRVTWELNGVPISAEKAALIMVEMQK